MSAEGKADKAEGNEMEDSQATEVSHVTPVKVLRNCKQCVAKT